MKVSVYIPTKNRLDSLKQAVQSVLDQTYQDFELIVVDDGSIDDTPNYMQSLAAGDGRIRLIRNEVSCGAPAARNAAILAATGDFVTGLDDDDRFTRRRLEAFVSAWDWFVSERDVPAFLYSQDVEMIDDRPTRPTEKLGYVTAEDVIRRHWVGNQVFAPRDHFIEAGLFDPDMPAWQDFEFWFRMLSRFGRGRLVDFHTYLFDVAPRTDRISINEQRIRRAYRLMLAKHPELTARQRQELLFHLITPYYGIKPNLGDWIHFHRQGLWPRGSLRLALSHFR